jgi:regulator of cell morphogenesis and NO signaling
MKLTLAELAIQIPASIELFEKHQLDYYQNGKQTLLEACSQSPLDYLAISAELTHLLNNNPPHLDRDKLSIAWVLEFINSEYHESEKDVLEAIRDSIQNVLNEKHTDSEFVAKVESMGKTFSVLSRHFIRHCNREDEVLNPYIARLTELSAGVARLNQRELASLNNPVASLISEHRDAIEVWRFIKTSMDEFEIPVGAPVSYISLIESLKDFEKDLHMHMHLENNVLFPKCLALEEDLRRRVGAHSLQE